MNRKLSIAIFEEGTNVHSNPVTPGTEGGWYDTSATFDYYTKEKP
ncbi:hypothetical protein AGMMS49545_21690 [Betaproteobacteria bacterium]|nr:hypothetical protein AGMMS49545_21690 [Betaproteobacteria bacterium]GHU47684.1 hypothetical protein AGMMS50289_23230 [Betaproteobacteria bacterium]